MGCLLLTDLVRNFRSGVVADARKSLANAVTELTRGRTSRAAFKLNCRALLDKSLKALSYDVLRSYPDVEGGYYYNDEPVGHTFPHIRNRVAT